MKNEIEAARAAYVSAVEALVAQGEEWKEEYEAAWCRLVEACGGDENKAVRVARTGLD